MGVGHYIYTFRRTFTLVVLCLGLFLWTKLDQPPDKGTPVAEILDLENSKVFSLSIGTNEYFELRVYKKHNFPPPSGPACYIYDVRTGALAGYTYSTGDAKWARKWHSDSGVREVEKDVVREKLQKVEG